MSILNFSEGTPPLRPTWDEFFAARLESNAATTEVISGYGERNVIHTQGGKLEQIIETRNGRNRKRVEIAPLNIGVHIADRVGVITDYGNYEDGEKEPAGHAFLINASRWHEPELAKAIEAQAIDANEDWTRVEITEPNQKGQIFKQETRESPYGVFTKNTIVSGPGHGRVWAVYSVMNEMEVTEIELRDGSSIVVGVSLGYGLTIEQGDISDKPRSEEGSTHYQIHGVELLEYNE